MVYSVTFFNVCIVNGVFRYLAIELSKRLYGPAASQVPSHWSPQLPPTSTKPKMCNASTSTIYLGHFQE